MPTRKKQHGRLSVFKGREAKLNKAIFQTLAHKGPQTIYDIYKQVRTQSRLRHTRYSSVNKRVRSLEKLGFIKKVGATKTKAGFEASIYELYAKAFLVLLLDSIDPENLLTQINEVEALAIIGILASTRKPVKEALGSASSPNVCHARGT